MARACSVCTHRQHASIDAALVQGVGSNRRISAQHGLTEQAVRRHAAGHLPAMLVKAEEAQQEQQAIDIHAQLKAINGASLAVLRDARARGQGELVLKAIDRVLRQIELQSKLLGILAEQAAIAAVNVNLSNPYVDVSDMDIDKRIDVMLQIFNRAKAREEAGQLPPGSAEVMEGMYGTHDARAALSHKLNNLAERRNHPSPELEPASIVSSETIELPRPRPQPVVVTPERRNGGWRAV